MTVIKADPARKQSVSEYCVQAIERYIYVHGLEPGAKLPSLREMCKLFGVSLTSLREAVKVLELRGEVEIRNGAGIYIRTHGEDAPGGAVLSDALPYVKQFGSLEEMKKTFIDMLEVRKMIESQVIECIIRTATDDELLSVQDYLDRLMFHYYHDLPTTEDDQVFHYKFYELCHNSILLDLAKSATNMYSFMWNTQDRDIDFLFLDTIKMHEVMFAHVRRRDLKNAKRVNNDTMDLVFSRLIKA